MWTECVRVLTVGKDFKIGLIVGLVVAVIALLWVATRPSLSPQARMLRSSKAKSQETSSSERMRSATNEDSTSDVAGPRKQPLAEVLPGPGSAQPVGADADSPAQQIPTREPALTKEPAESQSDMPDLTVYESTEKIKTTRFHIVRKSETLSAISKQYYGSANKWPKIRDANKEKIKDANRITPGTKLTIPD